MTRNGSGGIRLDAVTTTGGRLVTKQFAALRSRLIRFELVMPQGDRISRLIAEGRDSQGHCTVRWELPNLATAPVG